MAQKLYKNTFCPRVKTEYLTIGMIWRGLCASAIRPKDVPKDIMAEVERQYAGHAVPKDFKLSKG